MNKGFKWTAAGLLLFSFLFILMFTAAASHAAPQSSHAWVGNKLSGNGHEAWSKDGNNWVTGSPKGYAEGETAPFRITVDGAANGEQLKLLICLDLDVSSKGFGFTGIESWDNTIPSPGSPPTSANLTGEVEGVNAANGTIDAVTFLGENVATDGQNCGDDYLGWLVEFTVTDAAQLTYLVYGGHIAKDGDIYRTSPGGTDQVVPVDKGASNVNGNFQARIQATGTGDKSVNFAGSDIADIPSAVSLQSFTATGINPRPIISAVFLIAFLFISIMIFKRRIVV